MTKSQYRAIGVGSCFINKLKDISVEKNFPIEVQSDRFSTGFYEKCGFKQIGAISENSSVKMSWSQETSRLTNSRS